MLLVAGDDGEVFVVEVADVNEVDTVVVMSVQVKEEVVAAVDVVAAEVVVEDESTEDMDIKLKHCDMDSCRDVGSLEDLPCDLEALADLLRLPFSAPSPPSAADVAALPLLGTARTFLPTTCWAEAFSASLSRAVRDLKKLGFFWLCGLSMRTGSAAEAVVPTSVVQVAAVVCVDRGGLTTEGVRS